jgi:hypothetical protein
MLGLVASISYKTRGKILTASPEQDPQKSALIRLRAVSAMLCLSRSVPYPRKEEIEKSPSSSLEPCVSSAC